jgi:aspartyl-tRNA(Asn)/glutamyl-tRNA(Gln) amidotransferase subunit A
MTFAEARRALERDETSCVALVSSFLERIDADNDRINAFVYVDRDGALSHAHYLDGLRARGEARPLAGLVLGVKDNICIRGRKVTCSSRMLADFESVIDATVIERLRDLGAIFIGKTNCDEFAMGSSNESSWFGPVRNPLNEDWVPGGSSGGSAAAVAAGMCHAALGSDTGGSIRQPAAFCGAVGLKPTYGRVSRFGLVAFASSFDVIGPIANSIEDVAILLEAIAGVDPHDATSAPVIVPPYREAMNASLQGLRIGLPREYFGEGLSEAIRAAVDTQVEHLSTSGAEIIDISLPHTGYGIAAYYILTTAEASSNLARYDGVRYGFRPEREALATAEAGSPLQALYTETRTRGFGEEVKRRIMLGTYVLSSGYYEAYYARAQRVRRLIRNDFDKAFEQVDVILTPATPTPPFRIGELNDDPLAMYLEDVYTVTANLAGIPGLVIPVGDRTAPVGLQLLGRHFEEALLMQVGEFLMRS